ncbi:hypothetical protein ACIQM4_34465 [Streptomyces sp. NPDC091272]|uniref:hypothetical protein n=1 Tax=Streptomyces sp. NPDC091272 TaxID=3365981 RepID=UPI00382686C4
MSEYPTAVSAPMPVKPPKPPKAPKQKRPPRPMHARVTDALLVLLAAASLGLSGWSLATLLMDTGAPVWAGVLGVGVFDLVAVAAGLQVYARRAAPHTAGGARLVMMVALLASAVVNGAHGYQLGGWTTCVVLAAAPLSFEIVFELRHRTLTALIWFLFRKEAMLALRRDAWERIAPIAAQPVVTIERDRQAVTDVEPEPVHVRPATVEEDTRERLATSLARARAIEATPAAPQTEEERAQRAVADSLAAALAAGVPVADLLADHAAGGRTDIRTEVTPPQVSKLPQAEDRPRAERVPAQAPRSMAAGVRELLAAKVTDPEVVSARLSALMGKPVPVTSVRREMRRIRAAEAAASTTESGTGAYL